MRTKITSAVFVLSLLVSFVYAQEGGGYLVEKYRKQGPDPMVAKIIETVKEEGVLDIPELKDKTLKPKEGETPAIAIYRRELDRQEKLAQYAIRQRDYEKVIHHCDEGLKYIKEMRETKELVVATRFINDYDRKFTRWKKAAQEGIIQREALANFKKRQIKLEGIIWDKVAPVVILDGNSFQVNDPYKGIRIENIEQKRVNVIFVYKGRPFRYTLEFPEQ
jgi:hypothetical protein